MSIGTGEIIMLVVIGLIVFSASRMSALGNAVGKFVYSFKKAARGEEMVDVTPRPPMQRGKEDAKIVEGEKKS